MYNIPAAAGMSAHHHYISPWHGVTQNRKGEWALPTYYPELRGVRGDDPRAEPWEPGDYTAGADNVSIDPDTKEKLEWGGQKMWDGKLPPDGWDPKQYTPQQQSLIAVPHMPGQPLKEIFARQKALDPRPFLDRFFDQIHRTLPDNWRALAKHAAWFEGFGVNEEAAAAEDQMDLIPVVHRTGRDDTVVISIGTSEVDSTRLRINNEDEQAYVEHVVMPIDEQRFSAAPFDFLELLYARDHEGKLIQARRFRSKGLVKRGFVSYAFAPPQGTRSITPFACFNSRGAWRGKSIEWDPAVENEDMAWFTDMDIQTRFELAEWDKVDAAMREQVRSRQVTKKIKHELIIWPENSWQGNAAKARAWKLPQPS